MSFVVTPAPQISVPVLGTEARFPVHRIFADPYIESRGTGAFIVIDESSNNTVGAGMIV